MFSASFTRRIVGDSQENGSRIARESQRIARELQAFSANRQQIVLHRFRGFVVLCLRIRQIHFTFFVYMKQKMATCWGGWARLGEKNLPLYAGLEVAFDDAPPMRGRA